MKIMSPEILTMLLTMLGVGIAIIAVIVPAILYLSRRIDGYAKETNKRIDETNSSMAEYAKETNKRIDETNSSMAEHAKETNKRIDEQSREQAAFREDMAGRMGKLEGLLEGLRESIINKRAA